MGSEVPFLFVFECEQQWVTTTGSLIGTKLKFTNDFIKSYQGGGWGNQSSPKETIFL